MINESETVFLFFSAAILWQIVTHFIRTMMLRYYLSNGYFFEFSDEYYLYVPETKLYNVGLGNLWSRRSKAMWPVNWFADLTYILSCWFTPLLIIGFFYGDGGYVSISEIDAKLFLWVGINLSLAIPLNAYRYRKFKHQIKRYNFYPDYN